MDNFQFQSKLNPVTGNKKWRELLHKPWFILLLTGVVILGVIGFSINRIMLTLLHSRPEVVVPELEGKSLMESLRIVSELNLSLRQDRTEFDEGLPAGTILTQHPPAGMKVREGRSIQVVVSKGGQGVFIPNVIGRPLPEAQSVMQSERLQLGAVSKIFSVDANEGVVISQYPSSGTMVTRGTLVDLEVSKGMPPAGAPLVPDFIGQGVEQARGWTEGVGAAVKITEDGKAVGVAGTVVKQSPKPGQPLMEGDSVRLTVVPLSAQSGERFQFQVPSDREKATVKVMARDSHGESQIYKGRHKGGDTVELPISVTSTTRIRIYLDDALQEEKILEP